MPALIPTHFAAEVVWLGARFLPAEQRVIRSTPLPELPLGFAGVEGGVHGGLTRPACSRVAALYPRGTEIRNTRQLTVLSQEELDLVAAAMGLPSLDPALVGATMVVAGIPDLSHLPPSARLQGDGGATIVVDMHNRPCALPAPGIEAVHPGKGKLFMAAAKGRRGLTAWVEREGTLRLGERLSLHIPDQRPWAAGRG